MSFKAVAGRIAKEKGISKDRASAMLASSTRRTMKKHGMSVKHGIPKGVFSVMKKTHSPDSCDAESRTCGE
jgi:hypothetical protein